MSSLENVKVGDKLVIEGRWRNEIETVIKVTQLYVLTASYKFRKKDGCSIPYDRFISTHARPVTEEDAIKLNRLARRKGILSNCRHIDFERLSDSQLEQILEIAYKKEE